MVQWSSCAMAGTTGTDCGSRASLWHSMTPHSRVTAVKQKQPSTMADSTNVREDGAFIEIMVPEDSKNDVMISKSTVQVSADFKGGPPMFAASSSNKYEVMQENHPTPLKEASHNGSVHQSTSCYLPQVTDGDSDSLDDIDLDDLDNLILSIKNNYEFHAQKDKNQRKSHSMETIDNHIFVERNCEFFIEAEDAQAGHIVEMELRYLTGRHVNDPVYACEKHKDSTDSRYSFCVLRLSSVQKEEDQYGHLSLKIPVPNLPAENGNFFTIPVMFRCWNSCSKDYGKNQELILKLRDLNTGCVLKEKHMILRVCTQVKRDFDEFLKKRQDQGSKRSSEEKPKGPPVKRLKQDVQEGGGGMHPGEAETPAPLPLLPPCQDEELCVQQVKCDRASLPALKESVEKLRQKGHNIEMKEGMDGASPNSLPYME